MNIIKTKKDNVLEVKLEGRLDTVTSAELTESLAQEEGFTDILFDFEKLEYLSSSGLRLLFSYRKKLGGKEHVVLTHVNALISEILRVTGFGNQVTIR